jgi:phage terminase large subunit-like protein
VRRPRKIYEQIRAAKDSPSAYARAVVAGKIVAGPHVRDACRRHLEDLKHGKKRGLAWDIEAANRFIGFCRDVLRLNGGQWEGKPFILNAWQCFVAGSIFGWKRADGHRRFSTAFVETGKGSGKSPLAAAIGLYGLTADNEARAEIYAAATKKDQAMILFRDAVTMVDLSPALTHVIAKSGVGERTWNLAYRTTGSWFRAISSDDKQSGPRPHIALLDEIHEHDDNLVVEIMKAGQKGRRQPLLFCITNSGIDRTSVCWEYHDRGTKVASGAVKDDSFFAYICALDAIEAGANRGKQEDPLRSERCWAKVNPSLEESDLPGMRYLRDQVSAARGMPSKQSIVRRLNFCQWVESSNPAIARHVWEACEDMAFDPARLRGRRCYGGLDLSSTTDLTALALLFEPVEDDPYWRLLVRFWIPGDGLADKEERDKVPYTAWRDAGHINALPGRSIDKLAVARKCAADAEAYALQELGYDRWRIEDFKRTCDDEGITLPLVPCGQGYQSMTPAVEAFETALVAAEVSASTDSSQLPVDGEAAGSVDSPSVEPARTDNQGGAAEHDARRARMSKPLRHDGNPVLTWCAANTVYSTDSAGCRKPDKKRATGRIDGIVAAIMAAGRASLGKAHSAPMVDVW